MPIRELQIRVPKTLSNRHFAEPYWVHGSDNVLDLDTTVCNNRLLKR